ncbi:MAG: homoserine dehydrogenase, partial [Pseudomonadota bacterium]
MSKKLNILKIGGSVLASEKHLELAAAEIYRHLRRGEKVIAVVSALQGLTDRQHKQAAAYGQESSAHIPYLLATGEMTSASLLALTLERAGISTCI